MFDRPFMKGLIKFDNLLAGLFMRQLRTKATLIKGRSESRRLVIYFPGTGTHAVGMFRSIAPVVLQHGDALVAHNPRNGYDVDVIISTIHRAAVKYQPTAVTIIGVSLGSLTGTRFIAQFGKELNIDQFISMNGVTSREDITIDERKYFPRMGEVHGGPIANLVWWLYRWNAARKQPILPPHEYDPKVRRFGIIWQRLHNRYFPYKGYISAVLSIPDKTEQYDLPKKIKAYVIVGRNDWLVNPMTGNKIAAQYHKSTIAKNDLRHATLVEYPNAWQHEIQQAFDWLSKRA